MMPSSSPATRQRSPAPAALEQDFARWPAVLIAAISLSVLGMHAWLGSFSRFMGDDYCSAAQEQRLGILRAAWYWFRTWNGRYSANVLDAVFGALGPGITPIVTAFVLVVWLAALAAAVHLLSKRRAWVGSLALAAVILLLALELAPDVPQALYWGQGMRAIVPPLVIMAIYVALFACRRQRRWSGAAWIGASFALAYGAGGFSETYTALQLAMFVFALAAWFFAGRRALARSDVLFLSAGLLGALLSFITVVASPGNAARAAYYPPPPALPDLLRISLASYAVWTRGLFASTAKVLSLLAALLVGFWAGPSLERAGRNWRVLFVTLTGGVTLTFACFLPAAYGESSAPPDRTLLIPTFLLVGALVLLGMELRGWILRRTGTGLVPAAAVLILAVVAALSISRMASAQPKYEEYARAWAGFNSQLVAYRQEGVKSAQITTDQLNANNWARLNVLGDNPKFWLNQCISDYYRVNVISISP